MTVRGRTIEPSWCWLWALVPLAILLAIWPTRASLDDAYITLHNARVLLSGQADPVYGSSYLAGATSPIHLLMVAIGGLIIAPVWASTLIGLYGARFTSGSLAYHRAAQAHGRRRVCVLVLGAAAGQSTWFYVNGLETSLGMAAAAGCLYGQTTGRSYRSSPASLPSSGPNSACSELCSSCVSLGGGASRARQLPPRPLWPARRLGPPGRSSKSANSSRQR